MSRVRVAFFLSGVAGLVYEVVWTRYLGLFVGHTAYAQVLVLAVFLGGMAVGSLAISGRSKDLRAPLAWYVGAEAILGVFGLVFHLLFVAVTDFGYDVLFPAAGGASWVGAVRWGLAGLLILPQAVVLGTTFPLMAAGLVRTNAARPGGSVAEAYLLNTLGGAVGVLVAGFWMIGAFGLPGTSIGAAMMNLAAAALTLSTLRGAVSGAEKVSRVGAAEAEAGEAATVGEKAPRVTTVGEPAGEAHAFTGTEEGGAGPDHARPVEVPELSGALLPVLLSVAFATAMASFAYEIGWTRMLSLVLGSATHAFELMLSAFILGLGVGAWVIRRPADASSHPLRLLGYIQVGMGLTALFSLPLYLGTFDVVAFLVETLSGRSHGYALFNVGRYVVCMAVMLPSTVLAGMTLPLITGMLIRSGEGEGAIGRVYGVNTVGSVAGAVLAGLVALPYLGLEGLVTAGAAVDVILGVWLLERAARYTRGSVRPVLATALAGAVLFGLVSAAVELEPETITSGVYRRGAQTERGQWRSLFYQDGRTATVSAHIGTSDGVIVLSTNGKPDASVGPRWIMEGRDTLPELPIPQGRDFTTQVLAPAIGLAHRPDARNVANIGHGSGMTAASLLTSRTLERLVTIEIEPLMVEGSLVFLPANGPAFADPRVSFVFDDAKSFFSYRREAFDLIFAEPSNPWVSGTASLFTEEFYRRVTAFMSEGAVLAQWVQIYELNDTLFLSVLAALDSVFSSYRAYLVGDADVAIVASMDEQMSTPDWSVVENDRFRALTSSAPAFHAQHMEPLFLFDQETVRPLLETGIAPNSDFAPILDLGSERARFEQSFADGVYSLALSRVDLARALGGYGDVGPREYTIPPAYGLRATILAERANWLREAVAAGGGSAPEAFPEWQDELIHLQSFFLLSDTGITLGGWEAWSRAFVRAEGALHQGGRGWVDSTFYAGVDAYLAERDPPPEVLAVVHLMRGHALGDFELAARGADRLLGPVAAGQPWLAPSLLLDVAVVTYLGVGRIAAARGAFDRLTPRIGRAPGHARLRILDAWITRAESDRDR